MSSVKTNRPVMELVAEAKAEVMEEMEEDSNEEADEDESHDIIAVSASLLQRFCSTSTSREHIIPKTRALTHDFGPRPKSEDQMSVFQIYSQKPK